ncbi:MAG: hypothetical protein ACM3X1_09760 [Ignavibacteriales bacterium]
MGVIVIAIMASETMIVVAAQEQINFTKSEKQKIIVTWLKDNNITNIESDPVISISSEDFWKTFVPLLEQKTKSGNWRTNLLDIANQSQIAASQENMTGQGTSAPVFNTSVRMINFNGTGEHTHSITNFALESVTMPSNMTTIFNGTSTANFREGPITDIPTTITITNDKVISIWLDPNKINNHYGDTPVYGIVLEELH